MEKRIGVWACGRQRSTRRASHRQSGRVSRHPVIPRKRLSETGHLSSNCQAVVKRPRAEPGGKEPPIFLAKARPDGSRLCSKDIWPVIYPSR